MYHKVLSPFIACKLQVCWQWPEDRLLQSDNLQETLMMRLCESLIADRTVTDLFKSVELHSNHIKIQTTSFLL